HFLTKVELFDYFNGRVKNRALLAAKIAGRRRDCERIIRKERKLPLYLCRNRAINLDPPAEGSNTGLLRGVSTSGGKVTGIARVVKSLSEVDRVNKGEVLIVHSTDPGWTPVFLVVCAVVHETGGLLAHCSLLCR